MLSAAGRWFAALPTAVKLLLILSAALLPIGIGLFWAANQGIGDANAILRSRAQEQSRLAARSVESLVARNAMALRIAANGELTGPDPCQRVQRSLSITPAVARRFELERPDGTPICEVGEVPDTSELNMVAPGDIALGISPDSKSLTFRVGLSDGMATGSLSEQDLRAAAIETGAVVSALIVREGDRALTIIAPDAGGAADPPVETREWAIGNGRLKVLVSTHVPGITTGDRVMLMLPFLMWLIAALITWVLVTRLLIRPLRQLQRAVGSYEPGGDGLQLPSKLGPSTEIQDLRDSFQKAVTRVEESEREMAGALDGQRRLVREVHHRVKNNLQVVASLINIHGRNAESAHARAAYGSISRRVGALAIVHRNHFAEMEENRGISLRPLISELAAELRATAPESARSLRIDLDLEGANTTQDVAVSVAFLVTEIVEFAMLRTPEDPVEISLRRTSELTARLTLNSKVLNPDEEGDREKVQFERIISGLAKQLRSSLERKLGRYSVELPVFPPRDL